MAHTQHMQTRDGSRAHASPQESPLRSEQGHAGSFENAAPPEAQARVQRVLDRFARALTAGDGEAAADVWDTPAFVMGAGMARAVLKRAEVVEFFSGAKEQYTSRGIIDTRPQIQRFDWVSDDLVLVDVRWPYLAEDGSEIGEENSTYTLMADADGQFKIRHVVMRGAVE